MPARLQPFALEPRSPCAPAVRCSLVHVAPPGDGWLRTIGRDSLRMAVERADAEVAGRVRVDSALLSGSLATEVARVAADAALVVVEQLPPGALRRPEEASTAAALAEVIDVPVAVVPTDWIERHRRVVTVGLDPSAADDSALIAAMTLARLRGAALRVLVADPYSREVVDERLQRLGGDGCDLAVEPFVGEPLDRPRRGLDDLGPRGGRAAPAAAAGGLAARALGSLGWKLLGRSRLPGASDQAEPGVRPPRRRRRDFTAKEQHMYARAGDRIVIRSAHLGGPSATAKSSGSSTKTVGRRTGSAGRTPGTRACSSRDRMRTSTTRDRRTSPSTTSRKPADWSMRHPHPPGGTLASSTTSRARAIGPACLWTPGTNVPCGR